ncbi:uncharacterized protein LOC114525987 [Dendronephthya gigantea]|uniref:uncharacterized protein LOC114525987 n=1 Tax=Dendronephthya gigantea TaxID=151771 RepID=UPI00106B3B1E|nr:uncharacterized protein LOC114525987 [Dendronephthya gigantea]XP_028403263.1 uncharacterized protein LOC114525987 [Dendronephthya gigantea]
MSVISWESEEKRNFVCMNYIMEISKKELKKVFIREWNSRYQGKFGAWDATNISGSQLFHLEKERARPNKDTLQSKFLLGDTNRWDFPVLFDAILHSNSIGASLDPTIKTGVASLESLEEEVVHNLPGVLTNKEYQAMTTHVENAFKILGLHTEEIEQIKTRRRRSNFLLSQSFISGPEDLEKLNCDNEDEFTHFDIYRNQGIRKSQQINEAGVDICDDYNWWVKAIQKMLLNRKEFQALSYLYNSLGNACQDKGNYDLAKFFYQEALKFGIKQVGPNRTAVATIYSNLASVCSDGGDLKHAVNYYQQALDIQLQQLGSDHITVATSYNNLGAVCRDNGDFEDAESYHQKALKIQVEKLGPNHIDLATSYNNLGIVCREKGYLELASECHRRALGIQLENVGPYHTDVATSYYNLGIVCRMKHDLENASDCHQRALEIRLKKLGENNVEIATSYNNLGSVCCDKGDLEHAYEYHQRALKIKLEQLGPYHISVATSYNNLGNVCRKKGDLKQASDYYLLALNIQLEQLGPNHIDIATSYNNLGIVFRDNGDLTTAIHYHQRALYIRLEHLGPNHSEVSSCRKNLGDIFHEKGDLKQANEYYQQALKQNLEPAYIEFTGPYNNQGSREKWSWAQVLDEDSNLKEDYKNKLQSLEWLERFKLIKDYEENSIEQRLEIVCKFGNIPNISDVVNIFGKDILPFITYGEVSKTELFEKTIFDTNYEMKNKYEKELSSLSWVKDFEIGFDDKEEKTWQIYITYAHNEAPSMVVLKRIFGVHIASFVDFIQEKVFEEEKKSSKKSLLPSGFLRGPRPGDKIYNKKKENGTVSILVARSLPSIKHYGITAYHVCYNKKLPKNINKAHDKLKRDYEKGSKRCVGAVSFVCTERTTRRPGEFSRGIYNDRHDIALVRLEDDINCDDAAALFEEEGIDKPLASKKEVVEKFKEMGGPIPVGKIGSETKGRKGELSTPYGKTFENGMNRGFYRIRGEGGEAFAESSDSGCLVYMIWKDGSKIPFAYVSNTHEGVHYCPNLRFSLEAVRSDVKPCTSECGFQ